MTKTPLYQNGCCAMVLLNINQLNYIKMKTITAEELLKQEETTDKICVEFALWLTKKGNYNINNWNKTMAEMLETWKKEKFKHLINK